MRIFWKPLATAVVAVAISYGFARGEEAPQKPTKEACQSVCVQGFTKVLNGKDKDFFNQCSDAKFCGDPNTHYYAVEKPDQILRPFNFNPWVNG
jgi:hypothetical protein